MRNQIRVENVQLHPKLPEIRHQQGEGFLTGIRSMSRFCLGISAGVALVISLGTQMEVKFEDQVQEAIGMLRVQFAKC